MEKERLQKNREDHRATLEKWSKTLGEVSLLSHEIQFGLADLVALNAKLKRISLKYETLLDTSLLTEQRENS